MHSQTTLFLAGVLYAAYCESTDWKSAVTGADLPKWPDLVKDESKKAVVEGWVSVAYKATELPIHFVAGQPDIEPAIDAAGHPFIAEAERQARVLHNKALRTRLDSAVEFLKGSSIKSSERTLAMREIQSARHWLGEDLRLCDEPYPYPKGNDPKTIAVDPAADLSK